MNLANDPTYTWSDGNLTAVAGWLLLYDGAYTQGNYRTSLSDAIYFNHSATTDYAVFFSDIEGLNQWADVRLPSTDQITSLSTNIVQLGETYPYTQYVPSSASQPGYFDSGVTYQIYSGEGTPPSQSRPR